MDNVAGHIGFRPARLDDSGSVRRNVTKVLSKRKFGSVLLYTMGAFALAVFCSFVFSVMGNDTDFAIAVMGSLIGGFLGAMLAAGLIVDIYLRPRDRDEE